MPDILVNYASAVSETTLTGLSVLPGGHVSVAGERILTFGDSDTNCGIWVVVSGGPWTRATDFDTSAEVLFNQQIVPQGSDGANGIQAGSVFYVATTGTITPGTTAFSIVQRAYEEVQTAGVGIRKVGSDWQQSATGVLPGDYDRVTVDVRGNVVTGASSEVATTFLEGLRLVWLTNTSFRVQEGGAYVTGTGSVVDLAVDTDITAGVKGLPSTLAANTLYYVYLYSNAGVGDIEVSTQAPVTTPYRSGAKEKGPDGTPDNTRRYIGVVRSNAAGTALYNFQAQMLSDTRILRTYLEDTTVSPFRVVSAGTATTNQSVNLGPSGLKLVPAGCRVVWARIGVNATSGVWTDNSEMSTSPAAQSGENIVGVTERAAHVWINLDGSQSFRWANVAASGSTTIDIKKYIDGR